MDAIDLRTTYLVLEPDHRALRVDVDDEFWSDLTSGAPEGEGARLVAGTRGRLVGMFPMQDDWAHWERHPDGDEVLVLVSGRIELVLEEADGEGRVALGPGEACVVPAGVWHRAEVREPGVLLGMTAGRGTEHRLR